MIAALAARVAVLAIVQDSPPPSAAPTAQAWFADATAESGLDRFQQVNGGADKVHISEFNGAGLALFDCDGDEDLDVFFVCGSRLGGMPDGSKPTNRLFRNDGRGRFEDVTAAAGLDSKGAFGQGCAVADVNGDGRLDLFVANIGPDALYLNQGEGRFADVAREAGLADPRWSSGAAFLDYDRDGDLDLYVTHYIALEPGVVEKGPAKQLWSDWKGERVVKGPHGLPPDKHTLFRNDGNGRFTDVTVECGMGRAPAAFGFQPTTLDFDDDGDVDLFVSNDSTPNFLWRNDGAKSEGGPVTFTDVAMRAGVAFDDDGRPQSSMGVACADEDGDGRDDLYVTNFSDELNTLYRNLGDGLFEVATLPAGLGGPIVFRSLGWGTSFLDVDWDGDLDLFVANGHVYPQADRVGNGYAYGQRNLLFLRGAGGTFEDVTSRAGPGFEPAHSSRGSAAGDLDGDGDLDLVVSNLDREPTVLRNECSPRGRFAAVRLIGAGMNRAAIGARVELTANGRTQRREIRSSSSYVSHEDLRAWFGLGLPRSPAETVRIERIAVRWPDGTSEEARDQPSDRWFTFEQGRGLVGVRGAGS